MTDRKSHVGHTHGLEAAQPAPAVFPRTSRLITQRAESLGSDRGEERGLVSEVAVQRRSRDTERAAHAAQRQPSNAVAVYRAHGRLQQSAAEIAMVVAIGALPSRSGSGAASHSTQAYGQMLTESTS